MPLVSVIIPVYNVEKYLKECLDSVFSQTLDDFEVIAINDGSIDSSLEILNDYAKKDKRLKIISKNNEGQGLARNDGLKQAKGEFTLFLDSDDWLENNALEKLYRVITQKNAQMVFFNVNRFYQQSSKTSFYNYCAPYLASVGESVFSPEDLLEKIYLTPAYPFKFYRTSFLRENNYHYLSGRFWEDHMPHFVILANADRMCVLPEAVYNYRIHSKSSTANASKYASTIVENFKLCDNELRKTKRYKLLRPYFIQRKIQVAINYYFRINGKNKKIWYKNMHELFKCIKSIYPFELEKISYDKMFFGDTLKYPFYIFRLKRLYAMIKNHLKAYLP